MKDFYDVWLLSQTHEFDTNRLARAIAATFARRQTDIPVEPPDAFTPNFFRDVDKLRQWSAFVRDLSTQIPSFDTVIADISRFIEPATIDARTILRNQ
jgi:hypothetical protein